MDEKKQKLKWYESGDIITSLIIAVILAIIICSQSFAIMGNGSFSLFSSVINHNSIYLLILIYFILLKFKVGKKYFNYLNIFLVFLYLVSSVTSLLTVVQSFSLNTIFAFIENVILLVYLFHTMFRDTRIWRDFHLSNSPFNEISNDGYFNSSLIVVVLTLIVNLVSTVVVSGLFLSILDAFYLLLFGRYIYLYREYLDYHKLDSKNEGNFDGLRNDIQNVLDSTTIDDKAIELVNQVTDIFDKKEEKEEKKEIKKEKKTRKTKDKGDEK